MIDSKVDLANSKDRNKWLDQVSFHLNYRNWHECNATGEPALQNSWTITASKHFGFRFVPIMNCVHIHGSLTPGTEADGTLIFTLPKNYRPSSQSYRYSISTGVAGAAGAWLQISTTGQVLIYNADVLGTYYDVNIMFPLDV